MVIRDLEVLDLRFPTSRTHAGTDAVHVDPDYSAAYVVLKTDAGARGTRADVHDRARQRSRAPRRSTRSGISSSGKRLDDITADFAGFWRRLASDSQLRWLGPEKGVIHLALAAIVNAVWDLYAKAERKPVWKLLADMTPRQLVACIDFRYITDALTPDEAIETPRAPRAHESGSRSGRCCAPAIPPTRRRSAGWATPTTGIRAAVPRGDRRGVHAFQGEGRRPAR